MKIFEQMVRHVVSGLQRKSVTTCSKWASAFRVMGSPFPGPWTFKYHPWLREMHDSQARRNVGQKASQMGFTEWALNTAFYSIDIKRADCLYVLPAKTPDASDFSSGRFDPALELSTHLQSLFSDVKNVGHKRAGNANFYVRGSKSRAGLKTLPIGTLILDEVNEMVAKNIPLAMERVSGQIDWTILFLSTPTIPGAGITPYYDNSTQEHFNFKCPGCHRWTELSFPECLEITAENSNDPKIKESFYKCFECKCKLNNDLKYQWLENAKWIPSYEDRDDRGFHISHLYSSTDAGKPEILAKSFLESFHDPSNEQEFYNSKLGVAHVVGDAQITDQNILNSTGMHKKGIIPKSGLLTMGVDVGNRVIHYEIDQWEVGETVGVDINTNSICKVIDIGRIEGENGFEKLAQLMATWRCHFCVIDANPERRSALQFANRFFGHVRLCIYGQGINGKTIHVTKDDEQIIIVDRTSWLDLSLGRFRREDAIKLPTDTPLEYKLHLKAQVRTYKKDKDGNQVGRYENGVHADHYSHARNYSELALPFAAGTINPQSIESPV